MSNEEGTDKLSAGTSKPAPILYYNPYSVCSLMVLYTLVLRGPPKSNDSDIQITHKLVDIFRQEQLTETFLCDVNPEGQVPVLANITSLGSDNIPDSLKITHFLSSYFPNIIPSKHESTIRQLLSDLHALNYFSLSFPEKPQVANALVGLVRGLLETPGISSRYREALKFKLGVVSRDKLGGIAPPETAKNEEKARKLLKAIDDLLQNEAGWIFGAEPTALDAHLVPFLARITEVGRGHLIPQRLQTYRDWATNGGEWLGMMEGRTSTMVPPDVEGALTSASSDD